MKSQDAEVCLCFYFAKKGSEQELLNNVKDEEFQKGDNDTDKSWTT